MPGGELEPVSRTAPHLAGVAADMSAIFARAGASDSQTGLHGPPAVSALRPAKGSARATTLVTAVTAGIAGLAVGALVIHTAPSAQIASGTQRPPVEKPLARAAASAPPAAAPQAAPPVTVAEASLPPSVAPIIRAPVKAPASPPPTSRASARRRMHAPAPGIALAKAPVRHAEVPVAQPASCERNAAGPGCRRAVVEADRHLREVYESAIRRGVPRAVLIDYRDRWADLRESDSEDPTRLIERYGALAYDLGREARDDDEGVQRRRNPSGLKALANALLPWW